MKACVLLLAAGLAVTSSFPATIFTNSRAGITKDGVPSPVGSLEPPITDKRTKQVEAVIREKRGATNELKSGSGVHTSFHSSHVHQPRINLTINNVFEKGIPNVSVLNDLFNFVQTTFNGTHVHQPQMNITINNCF